MWKPVAVRGLVVLVMLVALPGSVRQAQAIPIRFEDAELFDPTLFSVSADSVSSISSWSGMFDAEDPDEPVFYPDPKFSTLTLRRRYRSTPSRLALHDSRAASPSFSLLGIVIPQLKGVG